jgi:hypothetical protein
MIINQEEEKWGTGDVPQVVKYLPSKPESLSLNPSTTRKEKEKKAGRNKPMED